LIDCFNIFNEASGSELQTQFTPTTSEKSPEILADTNKIFEECGWKPQVAIQKGIRAQWDWALANSKLLSKLDFFRNL